MTRKIFAIRKKNTDKMAYVLTTTQYRARVALGKGDPDEYEVLGTHDPGQFLKDEPKYKDKYKQEAREKYLEEQGL